MLRMRPLCTVKVTVSRQITLIRGNDDLARHLLLGQPDDDSVSCSWRILEIVTGVPGVIWGLDAPYEAIVHHKGNGFRAKITLIRGNDDLCCERAKRASLYDLPGGALLRAREAREPIRSTRRRASEADGRAQRGRRPH